MTPAQLLELYCKKDLTSMTLMSTPYVFVRMWMCKQNSTAQNQIVFINIKCFCKLCCMSTAEFTAKLKSLVFFKNHCVWMLR